MDEQLLTLQQAVGVVMRQERQRLGLDTDDVAWATNTLPIVIEAMEYYGATGRKPASIMVAQDPPLGFVESLATCFGLSLADFVERASLLARTPAQPGLAQPLRSPKESRARRLLRRSRSPETMDAAPSRGD